MTAVLEATDRFGMTDQELSEIHRQELKAVVAPVANGTWGQICDATAPIHEIHRQEWEARKKHIKTLVELDERKARYEENQPSCEACGELIPYTGKRGRTPKKCEDCRDS